MSCACIVALGCGPGSATGSGGAEGDGGSDSDDGSESSDGSGTGSDDAGSGGVTGVDDGDSTGASTTGTGDTGPGDGCDPPKGVAATWTVENANTDGSVRNCEVLELLRGDFGQRIVLDCGGGVQATVTIDADPDIDIALRASTYVELVYLEDPVWWTNRLFSVRPYAGTDYTDGDLILGGFDATRPTPSGDDQFFAPLEVNAVTAGCEAVPDVSGCGDAERTGIDVVDGGTTWSLLDGQSTGDNEIRIDLARAVEYRNVVCDDFAESWYSGVIVTQP